MRNAYRVVKLTSHFCKRMSRQVRSYHGRYERSDDGCCVIDVRSDTVTLPTPAMKEAMISAPLGDDVMGEDPTVNELQRRCAEIFGKEAALLVPTGTMGNLAAAISHCQGRFQEVILGEKSHMFLYENGSLAQFAGVQCSTAPNQYDGSIAIKDIQRRIRELDVHLPHTKMICLENTQNKCGGRVLPLEYMSQVEQLAKKNNLVVHLDGARIFNAAVALDVPASTITRHVDSISVCFSKGLACPVGSVLAGTKDFIDKARHTRKALGGGMRQAGVLAAAMLTALDTIVPRLHEDHARAKAIAEGIMAAPPNKVVNIDIPGVQTNIILLEILGNLTPQEMCDRVSQVTEAEKSEMGEGVVKVLMSPFAETAVRMVTHNDITDEDVAKIVEKFHFVLREMSSQ